MPKVLAEFLPIYRNMGALGWSQDETDRMDLAVCASFLGRGPEGDGTDYPPVIRGSRSMVLPKDTESDQAATDHVTSVQGEDRRAAYARARTSQPDQ